MLILVLITAFLDILGFSLLIPVLPQITEYFIVEPSWTMWAQAIYSAGVFVSGYLIGKWSDTYGRRPSILGTSMLNLCGYALLIFALSTPVGLGGVYTLAFAMYIVSRVVAGFGGGGFGAVQAYISDISTPADRTKNFGLMGAAFGMSFTIGPVIGGLLATYIEIIGVLYVSMGIIFINICFIYFFLREPAHAAVDTSLEKKDFHLSPRVVSLLFITLVATIGFSAIHGASTQYYVDKFAMDSLHIGYILSIVGIGSIIYQGILVQYVRRILDEKQMIYLAFIVLSIGMYCVAIITPAYIFWLYASVVLFPIGMGSMGPSVSSLLSQSNPTYIGQIMGYATSMGGLGGILGPLLVGWLYVYDITLPYYVSTGIFIFLLIFAVYALRGKKAESM